MLLSSIGDDALRVFNTFKLSDAERKNLSVVRTSFEQYCSSKTNVVLERFNFWQVAQKADERIDDFLITLRIKAKTCDYGEMEEQMIRDRLVIGCHDRRVQERLLREPNLDLNKALAICKAAESTREQLNTLHGESESAIQAIHREKLNNSNSAQSPHTNFQPLGYSRNCGNCGTNHPPKQCPAYGKQCHTCSNWGHFSSYCRSKQKSHTPRHRPKSDNFPSRHRYSSRSADVVSVAASDDLAFQPSNCQLGTITLDSVNKEDSVWWCSLRINNSPIQVKLDTGAQVNVMSWKLFNSLVNQPNIRVSNATLLAYGNSIVPQKGIAELTVVHRSNSYQLQFHIVVPDATPILGLPACQQLNLVRRVDEISTLDPMSEYPDVFQGLGRIPGEYHIELDPTITPVIHPTRRIPLSLQPKLKAQLKAMEEAGIICKRDEPTDWVSSILVVEKKDGSLRVCLDPRDLNRAIKREHFMIPTANDVISQLMASRCSRLLI
jgi:hypothetical protein